MGGKVYSIIGGGTSGLTALGQLIDRLIETNDTSSKVTIYEKDKTQLAVGFPYSSQNSSTWLLNGPSANRFKLLPDGKTLGTWMQESYPTWKNEFPDTDINEQFPPRILMGLYFKDQYDEIKQRAKEHGIIIEEKFEEVIDFNYDQDQSIIKTKQGNEYKTDIILLCFGHLSSDNFQDLKDKKNYISCWDVEALNRIPPNETLYIIGGHLSFIDVARELILNNHFLGNLVIVTRNPSLITMRDNPDKCDTTSLVEMETQLKQKKPDSTTWQDCHMMFWQAYSKAAKQPVRSEIFRNNYNTPLALSYQLDKLNKSNHSNLIDIGNIDELRDFFTNFFLSNNYNLMWQALDETGKEDFIKYFYSLLVSLVSGIPPINARFLVELYQDNRIQEKSGLSNVKYDEINQKFILEFSDHTTISTNYFINATGAGRNVFKHLNEYALLNNLYHRGLMKLTHTGAMALDNKHHLIDKNGKTNNNMYVIGPITYFNEKPGLSAVFLACATAAEWLDDLIPIKQSKRPSCF